MFVLCRASTAGCYSHIKPQPCLFHNGFISCLNNRSLSRLCWWKMQNSGRKDPNWGWFHHRFNSVRKQKQIRLLPDWKGLGKLDFDSGRGFFFFWLFCQTFSFAKTEGTGLFIVCDWLLASIFLLLSLFISVSVCCPMQLLFLFFCLFPACRKSCRPHLFLILT